MKILLIGGSGLVGSHAYRVLRRQPAVERVLATHLSYPTADTIWLDPLQPMPAEVASEHWDVIVHTGALTHVDKCETHEQLSFDTTVLSTLRLLELAAASQATFVYLSTDYIFDGEQGPYTEEAAPGPLNIYGRHKLQAENLVREYAHHLVLRITNVYGQELRHKNFIASVLHALKQQPAIAITAPSDQYATPVNAADIARAMALLIMEQQRGVYHLAGTDYVSRTQLLQRINRYCDNRIHITYTTTDALKQPARRPLAGGLLATRFLKAYPDFIFNNIDDYLKQAI